MPVPKKSSSNDSMDFFWINWQNKTLLRRIRSAKVTVDTKPPPSLKRSPSIKKKVQARAVNEQNDIMARRLADIYGRKNQYCKTSMK